MSDSANNNPNTQALNSNGVRNYNMLDFSLNPRINHTPVVRTSNLESPMNTLPGSYKFCNILGLRYSYCLHVLKDSRFTMIACALELSRSVLYVSFQTSGKINLNLYIFFQSSLCYVRVTRWVRLP